MKRRLFAILLVVATLSLLATSTTAHPPVAEDNGYNETENGFSLVEFLKLWSLDNDVSQSELSKDMKDWVMFAKSWDPDYSEPPKTPAKWNSREISQFNSGDDSKSVYPPNANLHDNEVVEDAYVHVFSIDPSTVMQFEDGDSKLFVRDSGTIRGTTDYRINMTEDKTENWPKKFYEKNESKVSKVYAYAILEGGSRKLLGKDTPSDGAWEIKYDSLPNDTKSIKVVATINVTVDKKIHKKPPEDASDNADDAIENVPTIPDDGNSNGTDGNENETGCTTCIPQTSLTDDSVFNSEFGVLGPKFMHKNDSTGNIGKHVNETLSYNMTVSHEVSVVNRDINPKARVAKMPDGSYQIVVWTSGTNTWGRMDTPAGSVETLWRYYLHRDTNWDTLIASTGDGEDDKTKRHSEIHPVKTFAYPSQNGSYSEPTENLRNIETYGLDSDAPSLHENITLNNVTGEYKQPFFLVFEYDKELENPKELNGFTFYSTVREKTEEVNVTRVREVKKPELGVVVLDRNTSNNSIKVRISLKDPDTGKYIKTFSGDTLAKSTDGASKANMEDERESYLLINNDTKVETYGRNATTVWVKNTAKTQVIVRYVPMEWYDQPDRENVYAQTRASEGIMTTESVWGILNFAYHVFVSLIPALLIFKILDKFLPITLWPPYPPRW